MARVIETTVKDAATHLAAARLPAATRIRIVIEENGETLADIARRCREQARRNGMTDDVFAELTKDI